LECESDLISNLPQYSSFPNARPEPLPEVKTKQSDDQFDHVNVNITVPDSASTRGRFENEVAENQHKTAFTSSMHRNLSYNNTLLNNQRFQNNQDDQEFDFSKFNTVNGEEIHRKSFRIQNNNSNSNLLDQKSKSIYVLNDKSSFIMHHHHFDAEQFKTQGKRTNSHERYASLSRHSSNAQAYYEVDANNDENYYYSLPRRAQSGVRFDEKVKIYASPPESLASSSQASHYSHSYANQPHDRAVRSSERFINTVIGTENHSPTNSDYDCLNFQHDYDRDYNHIYKSKIQKADSILNRNQLRLCSLFTLNHSIKDNSYDNCIISSCSSIDSGISNYCNNNRTNNYNHYLGKIKAE
jgi:hypothetical protein